jgi:hypothetical protein
VEGGLTHPKDLLALFKNGVRVCSLPRLHAKVYVFGKTAVVGSANASTNSADVLIESALLTNDRTIVAATKTFVKKCAKNELGPSELKRLQKLYRPPPPIPGAEKSNRKRGSPRNASGLPNIRVVHLSPVTFSDKDEEEAQVGKEIANRRREHPRSWKSDHFKWTGVCSINARDRILMINREENGRQMVDTIATVRYVRRYRTKRGNAAIVFYEHPHRRRRQLHAVASELGRGALKRLRRGGIMNSQLSDQLREYWMQG